MTRPPGTSERDAPARRDGAGGRERERRSAAPAGGGRVRRLPLPKRLPSRRAVVALVTLGIVCCGFGVWVCYGSSWLRVETVSVSGTRVLTEQRVRAAAEIPVGSPLVSVDTDAVGQRVRETLGRVKTVRVERAWPEGVSVKVTERTPELVIPEDGKYVEVGADGVRFATVEKRPDDIPLLVMEGVSGDGEQPWGRDALRRAAAEVVTALPDAVRRDTEAVRVRSYDYITVELSEGRTVLWGSPGRGAAKARSLTALMKAEQDARHFNVSVPRAPAASGS